MIQGRYWDMHDDQTVRKIESAAMALLVRGGACIQNDHLLDLLESAGCTIHRQSQRCFFTEKVVTDAVRAIGNKESMGVSIPCTGSSDFKLIHTGSHPHYLDWPSGERRLATCQDVVDMAKMAHVLDEFERVGKVFTCSEIDPRIEPLWSTLQIAKITNKPQCDGEVFFPEYLDDLVLMGEILTGRKGDTSLIPACDFFIQPLILEANQAECFIKKRELGLAICPGTMSVAGMSSPVTIAGTVALSLAELLAGWTLGYLLNPDLYAGGVIATATLDMRTMKACFSSPEALLQNISTTNIAMRLYGIKPWPVINYTDCKRPGFEAAFEKMMGTLCVPFGSSRGIGTDGLLSAGQDYSPVQQLLEMDMQSDIERFWNHFEVTPETISQELILSIVNKEQHDFITTDHTMKFWQSEHRMSRFLRKKSSQGTLSFDAEQALMNELNTTVKNAINSYVPPDVDKRKIDELESIFALASKRLI